jgi:hypothetical protein
MFVQQHGAAEVDEELEATRVREQRVPEPQHVCGQSANQSGGEARTGVPGSWNSCDSSSVSHRKL